MEGWSILPSPLADIWFIQTDISYNFLIIYSLNESTVLYVNISCKVYNSHCDKFSCSSLGVIGSWSVYDEYTNMILIPLSLVSFYSVNLCVNSNV